MKKLMIAAGAVALLAVSSLAAYAAEATGAITSVDAASMSVTLDDGNTYQLPSGFDAASLKAGDKVKITYDQANGKMTATAVEPAT
jgi:Cu/Ag efflux protein CusF